MRLVALVIVAVAVYESLKLVIPSEFIPAWSLIVAIGGGFVWAVWVRRFYLRHPSEVNTEKSEEG